MDASATPKLYKTLPGPLRKDEKKRSEDHHTHSPLFGLNLNLNFSNLISSGVSFFDNFRKKTPSTPDTASTSSHSSCSLVATSSLGEAIEMINLVETRQEEGTGAGHNWDEVGTHNPTWCDLCGELIWGLYAVGAWQCTNCGYYSHIKCRDRVLLDCSANLKVDEVEEDPDDEDDTDGQVASLCQDCPGASRVSTLTSVPSYRTARSDFSLPLLSVTDSTVVGFRVRGSIPYFAQCSLHHQL